MIVIVNLMRAGVVAIMLATHLLSQAAAQQLKIGDRVPDFRLKDAVSGKQMRLSDFTKKGDVLLVFVSFKCPHTAACEAALAELAVNGQVLAINSDNGETEEYIANAARSKGINYPILKDWNNVVADLLGAQVTPQFYIIGKSGSLNRVWKAGDDSGQSLADALAGRPAHKFPPNVGATEIPRHYNARHPH